MTPEGRQRLSDSTKRWQAAKTPEQRSEAARKGNAVRTPEQRRVSAVKRYETLGAEGRTARVLKRAANMSPERLSEIAKKGWAARRAVAAPKLRRSSSVDTIGTFVIYCLTNKVNGKKYIGQSCRSVGSRWRSHVKNARKGEGCPALSDAIRKYGPDSFTQELLETVNRQSAANDAEVRWIAETNCRVPNGYNYEAGGFNGPVHEETRRRMSELRRAYWATMTAEERSALRRATTTFEQRSEAARRANASRTPEDRSEAPKLGWAKLTPEQRSEIARKRDGSMTPEQRSERSRRARMSMTPEARSEQMRKANANRMQKRLGVGCDLGCEAPGGGRIKG